MHSRPAQAHQRMLSQSKEGQDPGSIHEGASSSPPAWPRSPDPQDPSPLPVHTPLRDSTSLMALDTICTRDNCRL